MRPIKILAPAKINLSLDVLRKRPDGYHDVEMIMHQISLFDEVKLKEREADEISIITDCKFIPKDSSNIAYKAADIFKKTYGIKKGVDIYINKNIPVAAGLAGGSSNAAAVLKGLNSLWDLRLSVEELMNIGLQIGADVPFCILGGAALAEGIGERLTPIRGLDNIWLVLTKPAVSVSTADVYGQLNLSKIKERPNNQLLLELIEEGDILTLAKNMKNVLETVTEEKHPEIKKIKKKMLEYNALGSMMSGSGPSVFGIYKNYEKAKAAYQNLSLLYKQTFIVQSYYRRNLDE